jgi:hypothetical protein
MRTGTSEKQIPMDRAFTRALPASPAPVLRSAPSWFFFLWPLGCRKKPAANEAKGKHETEARGGWQGVNESAKEVFGLIGTRSAQSTETPVRVAAERCRPDKGRSGKAGVASDAFKPRLIDELGARSFSGRLEAKLIGCT